MAPVVFAFSFNAPHFYLTGSWAISRDQAWAILWYMPLSPLHKYSRPPSFFNWRPLYLPLPGNISNVENGVNPRPARQREGYLHSKLGYQNSSFTDLHPFSDKVF